MRKHRICPRIVAFVSAIVVTSAGPALARGPKPARFKLTVSGVQTASWSRDDLYVTDRDRGCGERTLRGGTERLTFGTPRPLAVRATPRRYGGFTVPRFEFSSGRARATFRVSATIDRTVTDRSVDTCTGAAIPPDPPLACGQRRAPWSLTLASDYVRAGGVWLGTDARGAVGELYPNCLAGGFGWPTIQDHDPNGSRTWVGAVPNRRFFDARARRITVKARYSATSRDPRAPGEKIALSWTLVLTRVR